MGWLIGLGIVALLCAVPFVGADSRDGNDWRRPHRQHLAGRASNELVRNVRPTLRRTTAPTPTSRGVSAYTDHVRPTANVRTVAKGRRVEKPARASS
jgi:hypothetical protein